MWSVRKPIRDMHIFYFNPSPRITNSWERITNSRERIKIKYVHELVIRSLELLIRGNDLIKLFAPISLTIVDV